MDNTILVGLLSALSALAGAALTQWGAGRLAKIQAERAAQREAVLWSRQQAAQAAARSEEFLGVVLVSQSRMLDRLEGRRPKSPPGSAPDSGAAAPAAAARQAYAVALLYLDALRPLAKDFYLASARLQWALEQGDDAAAVQQSQAWQQSFAGIVSVLAKGRPLG